MSDIWEYVGGDFEFVITSTVHMTHYANLDDLNDYHDVSDYVSNNLNEGDCDDVDINNVESDFVSKSEHKKMIMEIRDDRNKIEYDYNKKLNEKGQEIYRLKNIIKKLEKQLKFIGGSEE